MIAEAGMTPVQIISSIGYIPGEPVTFTFKDSKACKETTFVPNRLLAKSKIDGATVEAIIDCLSPINYAIELKGFKKNEDILLKTCSYDEVMQKKITLSSDLGVGCMPEVIGQDGGVAIISFTRSSEEILSLELPWGLEWIKYITYTENDGKVKFIVDSEEFLKENQKIYKYFKTRLNNKNPPQIKEVKD